MVSILQLDLVGVVGIKVRFALTFGLMNDELAISIRGDVCVECSGTVDVVLGDVERYLLDEGVVHVRPYDNVVGVVQDSRGTKGERHCV